MLGAAQSLMTPELAEFFSAWLVETLPAAPPISQRSTGEWLIEQLDQATLAPQNPVLGPDGSAERGGEPVDQPSDEEVEA